MIMVCVYASMLMHVFNRCVCSMYETFSHHPTLLHFAASSQTPCLRMYHKCFHVFIFIETENTKNNPYPLRKLVLFFFFFFKLIFNPSLANCPPLVVLHFLSSGARP